MPRPTPLCTICQTIVSKYRCANCPAIRYCSAACFQRHIALGCAKDDDGDRQAQLDQQQTHSQQQFNVQESDMAIVSSAAMERLATSTQIRGALESAELRQIITKIDGSRDREAQLERFMSRNDDFRMFVDNMLNVVDAPA